MGVARTLALLSLVLAAPAPAANLAIQRMALHQYEDGPVVGATYEYLPGETAWFSARLSGYQREKRDDHEGARLQWEVRALDPSGLLLEPAQSGRIDERLLPEDQDWIPKITMSFTVPSFAPRGVYRIPVTVRDEVAGATVTGELEFHVRGEEAPDEASFGVRNFRFLAREDDRFALRPAVFQRGGTMFARFDMVGYKLEEHNRFWVNYGIAIVDPPPDAESPEKVLYAQPDALTDTQEPFYPQRWVPGAFSLNLDADAPTGPHTLVITVRDKLGGGVKEIREAFEVR